MYNEYDEPHKDLRELIKRVEKAGELLQIPGADWNLEMGTLMEAVYHGNSDNPPAIQFTDVPGFDSGYTVVSGLTNSSKRLAITLGFPVPDCPMDVVKSYRERMQDYAPIPHVEVKDGPILENIDRDDEVDLLKFPVPFLHELDGGRYIGTDDLVIMHDPEDDWTNIGTYRSMLHNKNTVGLWMSPGKQGRQIREKYWAKGEPCPVLISIGHDPLLFLASGNEIKYGLSEFAWAGGHRGIPFETVKSELYGLPMPSHSEIVLEGAMYPDETLPEGPFGEFTGYYASEVSNEPIMRVERVYYRHNPVMTIASPMMPPSDFSFCKCVMKSGMIWDEVEKAGINGVQGVWCHEAGGARMFNVISIKQAYGGHAKQAAMMAANCQSASYMGRWTIVVDEDIDPSNMFEVLWALSTRCDPAESIDFIRDAWSGPLDPRIPKGQRTNSRAIVDACRPFSWIDKFPTVARCTDEQMKKVKAKFAHILDKI